MLTSYRRISLEIHETTQGIEKNTEFLTYELKSLKKHVYMSVNLLWSDANQMQVKNLTRSYNG